MNLDRYTKQELIDMEQALCDDPNNRTSGGLFLYKPAAMKKMDAIRREIASKIREERRARGEFIREDGYTGRQTNRRR